MYWIMGQHSGQSIFSGVEYIGIFNPRLNMVWLKKVAEIDKNTIHEIESNVIGYRSDSIDISYDDESNNSGHQNDIGNPNYTQSNDELVDKIEELLAYKARTKRLLVLGIVLIPLFPISIVLLLIVLYRHHRQFSNKIVDISPSKNCINEKVSNCFERVWYELLRMNRLWLVSDISYSETKKNHAGADMLYNRQKMEVSDQLPEGLYSNQSIVVCKTSSIEIIFTPDKVIIIEKSRSVTVIFNKDLEINISNILYVEDEKIPEDAIVNRYVWEHPNKDGSPDRRYKQNKQLPECMYATIQIGSMNQNINIIFLASCYKTAQTMREIFMMV